MLFGRRGCTWFLGEAESKANVGRELDSPPRVRFNASRWRLRNSPGEDREIGDMKSGTCPRPETVQASIL